jgi:diguanylate cyclase (GGDEF)-like protein
MDLDNFKDVNDSLGRATGDDFLRQFSQRLITTVRRADIVCRQGNDQFMVGLVDVDADGVSCSANNILGAMRTPFNGGGLEFLSSCSIGVALFPRDGADFETLVRHAELAMRQAKDAGRNTVKFFNQEINTHITENLQLASSMRSGLRLNEFLLHYQPIYDLTNGALIGAEALVRWKNPVLGLVSPGLFVPVAERSGLIVEIGEWVLQESCNQLREWQDQGATQLKLAVNLSPVQFKRGNVEEVVEQALRRAGIKANCLELEVTESTLIQDTEGFIRSLKNLKSLGVRISIDDFGTGYSNLSYLQRFEVDKLKIDQSFVKRLLLSAQDRAIVKAIIQMARSLDLVTNAEGVEDPETLAVLCELGCDFAQGYHFARPLPAAELWKLWSSERLRMGYSVIAQIDTPANASAFGPVAESSRQFL